MEANLPLNELEQFLVFILSMPFGLTKKQLVGWALVATAIKVAFGFWLFGRLGFHLPW
tara:strand:+ start:434 stop:607 length:174 start_codon:yes stop_codon:yes gene_type:complete